MTTEQRDQDPLTVNMTTYEPPKLEELSRKTRGSLKKARGNFDAPAVIESTNPHPEVTPEDEAAAAVMIDELSAVCDDSTPKKVSPRNVHKSPPFSDNENEEEEEESNEEESSDDEDEDQPSNNKQKRVSYSKDLLKPTKEGSLIQSGVDVQAAAPSKPHTPDYIHKGNKLKATGYGDKVKKGQAVPSVSQPQDPNDKLGEMYKSVNMKSTGLLKQGGDVKKGSKSTTTTPKTTAPAYASVKLKQGQEAVKATTQSTTTAPAYASVNLKKRGNTEAKSKPVEPSVLPAVQLQKAPTIVKEQKQSKFPQVQLQKTAPVVKDSANTKFELPQEFSQAKQNLKRRTERPWYSNGVPEPKASKKWFFQTGEWNTTEGSEPKKRTTTTNKNKSSWFFSGSSKPTTTHTTTPTNSTEDSIVYRGAMTRIATPKEKVNVQHFNELGTPTGESTSTKKSLKTNVNKEYYENIQRRRKGLPPLRQRKSSLLWRLFVSSWIVRIVFYGANHFFPEEMDAAWNQHVEPVWRQQVKPRVDPIVEVWRQQVRPHVDPIVEQVQPHVVYTIEQVQSHVTVVKESIQPHVAMAVDRVVETIQPHVAMAVDRVCAPVESHVVPDDQKWAESIHDSGVAVCAAMRSKVEASTEEESAHATDHEQSASGRSEAKKRKEKRENKNSPSEDCECDTKGPKWWWRGNNKDKQRDCCNREKHNGKEL